MASLKDELVPDQVNAAAQLLVRRMISERDASMIGMLASPPDDLDEGLTKDAVGELATLLAGQMIAESDLARILT